MLPSLRRLTLVIPTINRPDFVRRQIEYWKKSEATVMILDGASQPLNLESLLLSAPNITYVHTGAPFNVRVSTAGAHIKTEFVALLPDDEFFLPSGLDAAIRHLDSNPETIGVVGRALYFFVDQGRFLVSHAYREWKEFPKSAISAGERLNLDVAPNKTHKILFGLFRREKWTTIFTEAYGTFYSTGYTYERLANLASVALGRTDLIENLIWMRSMENPPISNEYVPRLGSQDFVPWATEGKYPQEVAHFRAKASRILRDLGGLDLDSVRYFEDRFFNAGIKRQIDKVARRGRNPIRKISTLLIRHSPKHLKNFAKRRIPSKLLSVVGWSGVEIERMSQSLEKMGTSHEIDELIQIRSLVLKTTTHESPVSNC